MVARRSSSSTQILQVEPWARYSRAIGADAQGLAPVVALVAQAFHQRLVGAGQSASFTVERDPPIRLDSAM